MAYDKETPDFTLKKGRKMIRYVGEPIPAPLVVERFFAAERAELEVLETRLDETAQRRAELEEEHGGDEGVFDGLEGARGGIAKGSVQERVMELQDLILKTFPEHTPEHRQARTIRKTTFGTEPWQTGVRDPDELFAELDVLHQWLHLSNDEIARKKALKNATKKLYEAVVKRYPALTEEEIKRLVVEDKWFAAIEAAIHTEVERVTQRLAGRVQALEERYADPLPTLVDEVAVLSRRVDKHLRAMGVAWN
jgi:type I restriction enzyme M protein